MNTKSNIHALALAESEKALAAAKAEVAELKKALAESEKALLAAITESEIAQPGPKAKAAVAEAEAALVAAETAAFTAKEAAKEAALAAAEAEEDYYEYKEEKALALRGY